MNTVPEPLPTDNNQLSKKNDEYSDSKKKSTNPNLNEEIKFEVNSLGDLNNNLEFNKIQDKYEKAALNSLSERFILSNMKHQQNDGEEVNLVDKEHSENYYEPSQTKLKSLDTGRNPSDHGLRMENDTKIIMGSGGIEDKVNMEESEANNFKQVNFKKKSLDKDDKSDDNVLYTIKDVEDQKKEDEIMVAQIIRKDRRKQTVNDRAEYKIELEGYTLDIEGQKKLSANSKLLNSGVFENGDKERIDGIRSKISLDNSLDMSYNNFDCSHLNLNSLDNIDPTMLMDDTQRDQLEKFIYSKAIDQEFYRKKQFIDDSQRRQLEESLVQVPDRNMIQNEFIVPKEFLNPFYLRKSSYIWESCIDRKSSKKGGNGMNNFMAKPSILPGSHNSLSDKKKCGPVGCFSCFSKSPKKTLKNYSMSSQPKALADNHQSYIQSEQIKENRCLSVNQETGGEPTKTIIQFDYDMLFKIESWENIQKVIEDPIYKQNQSKLVDDIDKTEKENGTKQISKKDIGPLFELRPYAAETLKNLYEEEAYILCCLFDIDYELLIFMLKTCGIIQYFRNFYKIGMSSYMEKEEFESLIFKTSKKTEIYWKSLLIVQSYKYFNKFLKDNICIIPPYEGSTEEEYFLLLHEFLIIADKKDIQNALKNVYADGSLGKIDQPNNNDNDGECDSPLFKTRNKKRKPSNSLFYSESIETQDKPKSEKNLEQMHISNIQAIHLLESIVEEDETQKAESQKGNSNQEIGDNLKTNPMPDVTFFLLPRETESNRQIEKFTPDFSQNDIVNVCSEEAKNNVVEDDSKWDCDYDEDLFDEEFPDFLQKHMTTIQHDCQQNQVKFIKNNLTL